MDIEKLFPRQSRDVYGVPRDEISIALDTYGMYRQAEWFSNCHEVFNVRYCPVCHNPYVTQFKCRLRICPDCGGSQLHQYIEHTKQKIEALLEKAPRGYRLRRVVLTLPPRDDLTVQAINDIRTCFNSLRRSKLFKEKVNHGYGGGLYSIETKFRKAGDVYINEKHPNRIKVVESDSWNVHMHLLILSKYIKQKDLAKAWFKASKGRSYIVFIDEADTSGQGIYEAVKYCFKPHNLKTAENYAKYMLVWKGRRRWQTFGSFRNVRVEKRKGVWLCPFHREKLSPGEEVYREDVHDVIAGFKIPRDSILAYSDVEYVEPVFVPASNSP